MRGYDIVADALHDCGIRTVFGFVGDANMHHVSAFKNRDDTRFVPTVHEAGALGMADGFSRLSGTVGVATVTHGPGTTNTLTPLIEAVKARSALLLLTGDTAVEGVQLQHTDLAAFATAAGARYRRVRLPDHIGPEIRRAMDRCFKGEGPIVLDLPIDVQLADARDAPPPPVIRTGAPSCAPTPDDLRRAIDILAESRAPLILAGRGAAGARSSIIALAAHLDAAVATTLLGQGIFSGHPYDLGVFGGLSHSVALQAIGQADCVIAFGASLNAFTTGADTSVGDLLAGKPVIQVDKDPLSFSRFRPVDVELLGDSGETAQLLAGGVAPIGRPSSLRTPRLREQLASRDPRAEFVETGGEFLDQRSAIIRLNQIAPADRVVVTDGGNNRAAAWRYMTVNDPANFLHTTSFASIGLGLAASIGAALAHPDQITLAMLGDGAAMMSLMEFTTAVRERARLVTVVFNNGSYGTEYFKLEQQGLDPATSVMQWPDFATLARALGGDGATVRSLDELDEAWARAEASSVPFLIDVRADPRVNVNT